MANFWSELLGDIQSEHGLRGLAVLLEGAGLGVEVRDSIHYTGGQYIRIFKGDDFTLECVKPGEYVARAYASSIEQLHASAFEV